MYNRYVPSGGSHARVPEREGAGRPGQRPPVRSQPADPPPPRPEPPPPPAPADRPGGGGAKPQGLDALLSRLAPLGLDGGDVLLLLILFLLLREGEDVELLLILALALLLGPEQTQRADRQETVGS